MCDGIALAWSEFPTETIGRHRLGRRVHERGGEREVQFLYRERWPQLPVWRDGRLIVVRWGNGRGRSRFLPRTGWTWQTSIDAGDWRNLDSAFVDVPATLCVDGGMWYKIRQGMRGLLVADEKGWAVVYLICEPSSHYYRNMTGRTRMPVFIAERF